MRLQYLGDTRATMACGKCNTSKHKSPGPGKTGRGSND